MMLKESIMVIAHNMLAMNASRQYNLITDAKAKTTEKLSSGYRINRAADDAAGLSISEKMRRQIRGLDRAAINITDGVSFCQIADGALDEVDTMIHRVNELAIQAANGTNSESDRRAIQDELDHIAGEIDRIGETTKFNEIKVFDAEAYAKAAIGDDAGFEVVETPTAVDANTYKMNKYETINGKNTPSVSVDFQNISISSLPGKSFFLTCSVSCPQVFMFSFSDDTDVSAKTGAELGIGYSSSLYVNVGIKGVSSGTELVGKIADALKLSSNYTDNATSTNDCYQVGHNNDVKIDGSKMTFYSRGGGAGSSNYPTTNVVDREGNVIHTGITMSTLYMDKMDVVGLKIADKEIQKIPKEIDAWDLLIQSGEEDYDQIELPIRTMNARKMGLDPINVMTQQDALVAIDQASGALAWVNELRSLYGAKQNRLEHAYNIDKNTSENTQAGESRIRDTDMADEMVKLSIANVLSQAGEAMIAQSNKIPENVLSLLQQ